MITRSCQVSRVLPFDQIYLLQDIDVLFLVVGGAAEVRPIERDAFQLHRAGLLLIFGLLHFEAAHNRRTIDNCLSI